MRTLFAVASLLPTLLAQAAPDPLRFVPSDAVVVVRIAGPAGWQELAATGVGKAFTACMASESGRQLLAMAQKQLDPDGKGEAKGKRLFEALASHAGDLVLAGLLDCTVASETKPPGFCIALSIPGDGKTDLAPLQKAIDDSLPAEPQAKTIEGRELQVHAMAQGELTAPLLVDGSLVMLWASDLEHFAPRVFAPREVPFAAVAALRRGVIGVQIEPHQALTDLGEACGKLDDERGPRAKKALDLSGVLTLQRATYSLFADGAHLGQEARMEWNATPRGIFDIVLPASKRRPALLAFLPPVTPNWTIGTFDVAAAQALYRQAFAILGPDIGKSQEEIEGAFTDFTKLLLHEDFLALIGSEYLRIDDFSALGPDEDVDPQLEKLKDRADAACYAVQLRDGKKMAVNFEKAVRARGLHAGRKTETYGDVKVHQLKLLGSLPIEYAFVGDLFVVGIGDGEGTQRNLRRLLDTVKAQEKQPALPELAVAVQQRLLGWPEDWAAIDVGGFTELLDGLITMLDSVHQMLRDADVEPSDIDYLLPATELSRGLRAELVRHQADVTVTVWYQSRDAFLMRSRW